MTSHLKEFGHKYTSLKACEKLTATRHKHFIKNVAIFFKNFYLFSNFARWTFLKKVETFFDQMVTTLGIQFFKSFLIGIVTSRLSGKEMFFSIQVDFKINCGKDLLILYLNSSVTKHIFNLQCLNLNRDIIYKKQSTIWTELGGTSNLNRHSNLENTFPEPTTNHPCFPKKHINKVVLPAQLNLQFSS